MLAWLLASCALQGPASAPSAHTEAGAQSQAAAPTSPTEAPPSDALRALIAAHGEPPQSAPAESAPAQSEPAASAPAEFVRSWTLSGRSSDTLFDADSALFIVQSPVFRRGEQEAHASWAIFWIDRAKLQQMSPGLNEAGEVELVVPHEDDRAPALAGTLFEHMQAGPLAALAREVYLEGPVELYTAGELIARSEAVYLDLVVGHGWIADATLFLKQRFLGGLQTLRAHADWLRCSANGTMRANKATITTCTDDVPHIYITSGDLRIRPNPGNTRVPWLVDLHKNRVTLFDLLSLPLPSYNSLGLDRHMKPTIDNLRLGNSARFGFSVGAQLNFGMGKFGKTVNEKLGGDPVLYEADTSLRVSLHGSRGLLIDPGVELSSPDLYWLDVHLGFVPDRGKDKGLLEVPEEDRGLLRRWFRGRGRYHIDKRQWIDLALSTQSDAAVQSEFWESQFLRYEQRDNYLHWRRAREEDYAYASVKWRFDDFRTDIEELPSLGYYHGRAQLLDLGATGLEYTSRTNAAYLRRLEGEPGSASPFELPSTFADGFGERDVLRADTRQRVELPLALGLMDLRLTPFTELRGTAWSEDETEQDSPTRGALIGGARLAAQFWRRAPGGDSAVLAPYLEVREDLALEQNGGIPVVFDEVEESLDGRIVEAGVYTSWKMPSIRSQLQVELRQAHASSVGPGAESGWRPMGVLLGFSTMVSDVSIGLLHDARYDFSPRETVYSLTSIGAGVKDHWGVELSHRYGRSAAEVALFEAASIAARYRWTPKWEWEGRETFALLGGGTLSTTGILRRYGHDTVFEIELGSRSGEGGPTINFNFRPLIGYDTSDIGMLDPWDQ